MITPAFVPPKIDVHVDSFFVAEESKPDARFYFFSYHVRIHNNGPHKARLLSRHWIITDGHGRTEEVRGPGVVGQQPTLEPGETFEYTSACPLATPTGSMKGAYTLVDEQGREFEVAINEFYLLEPNALN